MLAPPSFFRCRASRNQRLKIGSPVQPWFIATTRFGPDQGQSWEDYRNWSGLHWLEEVVSLDPMLCPTVLREIRDVYWPYIVNEDFLLDFFTDLDFLRRQLTAVEDRNLLCVFRNPALHPVLPAALDGFEFIGYDLVDVCGGASALTNCGGFPDVFDNAELNSKGLLPQLGRAREIQRQLRIRHPEEHHADCHLWAIFRE